MRFSNKKKIFENFFSQINPNPAEINKKYSNKQFRLFCFVDQLLLQNPIEKDLTFATTVKKR